MKKLVLMFLALHLFSASFFAQPDHDGPPKNGPSKEKIESLRRAFYTKELNLNPQEAEKFWPIYNEFEENKKQHQKKMKTLQEKAKGFQTLEQLDDYGNQLKSLKQEEAEQVTNYIKKSAQAIGLEKAKILIGIDAKFKKEMGEKLKERKQKQNELRPKVKR